MAENKFEQFRFPPSISANDVVQGPYYWRSDSGVGEDISGTGRDYYWLEYAVWNVSQNKYLYRRIIYWYGQKYVDRQYDRDTESQTVDETFEFTNTAYGYARFVRPSYPHREYIDMNLGDNNGDYQYWELTREDKRSFNSIYNYNAQVRAPKTLMAPPNSALPWQKREPLEADYYLYGWRNTPTNDSGEFAATSKDALPWALNCDVGVKFDSQKISKGLFKVSADVYNDMRTTSGNNPGPDISYVHTADKTHAQKVRYKYVSQGKYYFQTDDYYGSTGQEISSSDQLFYSDTRWSVNRLGGATFFGFDPAFPKRMNFMGQFDAVVGDYIFDKERPDDYYKVTAIETFGDPLNGYVDFDKNHHFTSTAYVPAGQDLYYSRNPKGSPFRIYWDYPPTVSNVITNYNSYAIYPQSGFTSYELEIPYSAAPYFGQLGADTARAGIHGAIGPQQRETLVLNMNRQTPSTSYTNNVGHLNSGFCVVPFKDNGFGFNIDIQQPPSTHIINIIEDNDWYSVDLHTANCELIGDKNIIQSDFVVRPIKANEHFECKLSYRYRQSPGGSYIYSHFVVKGFYLAPGNFQTIAREDFMNTFFTSITDLPSFDIAGDQSIGLELTMTDLYQGSEAIAGQPQKLEVRDSLNCLVFDTQVNWDVVGGKLKNQPITILPTGDPWSLSLGVYAAHLGAIVNIPESRYYGDHGLQVWNENGETRLNTSSRHPRIIYTFAGQVDYPVGLTVPEFMARFDNLPFVEEEGRHSIQSHSSSQSLNMDYKTVKYGIGSYYCDRSTSRGFKVAPSDDFKFGTGDFTIEFWTYQRDDDGYIFDHRHTSNQNGILIYWNANQLKVWKDNVRIVCPAGHMPLNEWVHIAVCRSGTNTKLFVNGVQKGSTWTSSGFTYPKNGFSVGSRFSSYDSYRMDGNIDELRIIKGEAKYTSNFTPPISMHLGNNQKLITDTEIPELAELVNDGTWHINMSSEFGLTEVAFDYGAKAIILNKTLPSIGNVYYSSDQDYARFQVLRI